MTPNRQRQGAQTRRAALSFIVVVLLASGCTTAGVQTQGVGTQGVETQGVETPGVPSPDPPTAATPATITTPAPGGPPEPPSTPGQAEAGVGTASPGGAAQPSSTPGRSPAQTPSRAPAASPTPAPQSSATQAATAATGARIYTSPTLRISFSYLPNQGGQTIKVLEQGDKIYVYDANTAPAAGQWVQVFHRTTSESLVDAVKRAIMRGYPAQDCQIVQIEPPACASGRAANFEYAGIAVRKVAGESEADMLPRWRTCPQPYTVVGGIGYFQADALHPDRFLFVSIGQYFILAGDDLPWQATIRLE